MNYTELKANIEDITENTFTDDQLAMFTKQAEQKIFNTVQIPALRKNQTGNLTQDNKYLTAPSDFLYNYSLAVIDGSGNYHFLINKDVNFIREAYPNPTSTGLPKHYGYFDDTTFILGPTPDAGYSVELHYGYYPRPMVVHGDSVIQIDTLERNKNNPLVTCDGQVSLTLKPGDSVVVRKKPRALRLLHPPGYSFYASCRDKLRWSDALTS